MRIGPLALLVTAALAACNTETVEETADLLAEGGEILLRDTLRPPRGGPRVLVFGLDGVGDGALRSALAEGALPSLAAVVGAAPAQGDVTDHGWLVPAPLSVLPSITLAAWSTLFTGEPPARTGVPGNEWFDRGADAFRAPAPVSVSGKDDALGVMTEGLLGEWIGVPTLFERADVRSHVSFLPVHRGADVLTIPSIDDLVSILGAFSEGVVADEPVDREVYSAVDAASAEAVAQALDEHGVPDLQVVYFPGVDLYTHAATTPLPEQKLYIREILDPAMATVLDAYRSAGVLADTWVVVVSDHGHTPVPADDRHALGTERTLSPRRVLDSLGWRVAPAESDIGGGDHQAVLAFQGAFAYAYLADRTGCADAGAACDWGRPPRPDDVDSVAAAFHRHVVSPDDDASGAPLQMVLVPRRDEAGALTDIERWTDDGPRALGPTLTAEEDSIFLRLADRLEWLLDGPRGDHAGDVVLMARSGAWVADEERFYFSHPYHSWHGSAHALDSEFALLVARPDMGGGAVRDSVRPVLGERPSQLDFTRLVLTLLGRAEGTAQTGPAQTVR